MRQESKKRKPGRSKAKLHKVNFLVDLGLFKDFRDASKAVDLTVSQELRRLMRERVAEVARERPAA
jgi:hypothetical protein